MLVPWANKFSVVIEKTARELAGVSCLELADAGAAKAGNLLQPNVRYAAVRDCSDQGGRRDLHPARSRKATGTRARWPRKCG